MIDGVRMADLLLQRQEREQEQRILELVRKYARQQRPECAAIAEGLGMGHMLPSLHLVPCVRASINGGLQHVCFDPRTGDTVKEALRSAEQPNRFVAAVDAHWAARCKPILDSDWCGERDPGKEEKATQCSKAGICICSPAGKRLYRFRNRVLAALKFLCPRKTTTQKLLVDGHLVVRLRGRKRRGGTLAAWFSDDDDEELAAAAAEADVETHFWHVAFLLRSPYMPIFQPMKCVGMDANHADDHMEVALEAEYVIVACMHILSA